MIATGTRRLGNSTVQTMLAEAKRLLGADPAAAAACARRVLAADPHSVEARFLLGAALRRHGVWDEARAVLAPLAAATPRAWGVQYEYGMALAALGDGPAAAEALDRATRANPASSLAWHALGDQLLLLGRSDAARDAQARRVPGCVADQALGVAARAFFEGREPDARATLHARFGIDLNDLGAVRLLSDVALQHGQFAAAEALLAQARRAAPDFVPAQFAHAIALHRLERGEDALAAIGAALQALPGLAALETLAAAIHMQLGDVVAAITAYQTVLAATPDDADAWHGLGHALRAVGRQDEAVAAYRRAVALRPGYGEAYWSLANLKTVRFDAAELTRMLALPAAATPDPADRAYLDFALGKALEDEARYAESFAHYARGNAARAALEPHDAAAMHRFVADSIAAFDADLFRRNAAAGCAETGPIFVLGMPRSGSTLVEQILASHSAVDGASELPDITTLARELAQRHPDYPGSIAQVPEAAFAALGRAYIERTAVHRAGKAWLVDKFPGNFLHTGLIQLMLPNARIIDIRRDPMACCFSLFKQAFARGQAYSYDLADLGHYYRDYVALMAHFDAVLPGRVHRIGYEALIDDPETEIRRLLAYCGLPFEPQCLRFFETGRAVRTPSSEQVRRPINRDGLDQWRPFEAWLTPLADGLGPLAKAPANRH
ncbi:tetratricopeptide repeat-containing sulfotransferase family protein [Sphingomonas glacialis]|uniref:Sulfotransferase family protein n=1 Tax=Sphingomonas glacialis TaxID=658225 RepID=A0A502FLA3_9SPHN|nr:tetratricopeptide repeat-containing sulfotransferase family protein [Sphingomonas glacialis]TPG49853.1 sulfotransferase family protein [Sphingomonas glacialis]